MKEAMYGGDAVKLDFEDEDTFWVPVKGTDSKTKEIKIQGYVRLSLTVLPKSRYVITLKLYI